MVDRLSEPTFDLIDFDEVINPTIAKDIAIEQT